MSDITPDHDAITREKSVMRLKMRAARRAVSPEAREAASTAIASRALELPELTNAGAVMVYGASPEEIDPRVLERELRARGVRIAYPRVAGLRALTIHWVDDPRLLVPGAFGLLQPGPAAPEIALATVSAVIVPGIAFDESGNRLGFGGGYYDVLLADPHVPPTIGIAYDEQVVDGVPHDGRDRPVDVLLTPTRTVRCATSRT